MHEWYDVIVIGGGHAGTEAAWAAANVLAHSRGPWAPDDSARVALITMDAARIGQMSCNPAIGGLGKGQMVREIDALGGLMGRAIDATGIMFKMLNTSKGAAVRGPRAQADKYAYAAEVQRLIASHPDIDVIAATVDDLIVENDRCVGVILPADARRCEADQGAIEGNLQAAACARRVYPAALIPGAAPAGRGEKWIRAGAVVLTTGTFMRGLMHTGERRTEGGRVDEGAAQGISTRLRGLGFELGRLKTGTPPRLARQSLDWDQLPRQSADLTPVPFSDLSPSMLPGKRFPRLPQTECRLTSTTAAAHELIRANLDRAPMFTGQIDAETGPRYCPSIEDKVVRFADRDSHHVFLEPESLHTSEVYCNGISTSLPTDVQEQIVRQMPGCEHAEILRWGYAVEYDMVWPHQIDATCMTKRVRGLFFAGQINCTTGYEEAGAQGLLAGLNAARLINGDDLVRFERSRAFLGVMMDDLVTKTPREPYRMFTSRAEHRLHLRADNADARLTEIGHELGLVSQERWERWRHRARALEAMRSRMDTTLVDGKPLRRLMRRPDVQIDAVLPLLGSAATEELVQRLITETKYEGYLARQGAEVRRQREAETQHVPAWLDYRAISGLRTEARDVLTHFRPSTLGQARRLSGVNPADITLLRVAIRSGPPAGVATRPGQG